MASDDVVGRFIAMELSGDRSFKEQADRLVADFSTVRYEQDVLLKYDDISPSRTPRCKGLFGFLLFTWVAEQDDHAAADSYLRDKVVLEYICELYEVRPNDRDARVEFHKLGNTSYILRLARADRDRVAVLKLIKPQFFANQRIREETEGYRDKIINFQDGNMPSVEFSNARHIVMEYINGVPLREHIQHLANQPAVDLVADIVDIITRLCRVLSSYASKGLAHGDLTPDNIIVEVSAQDGFRHVRLLDFGVNYVFTEVGIRSADALLSAERYRAPEFRSDHKARETSIGDVYSLGAVLLELLFLDLKRSADTLLIPVLKDENVWGQDFSSVVDRLRLRYYRLGDLLDELLDDDPHWRALALKPEIPAANEWTGNAQMFAALDDRISTELKMYSALKADHRKSFAMRVIDAVTSYTSVIDRIKEAWFQHNGVGGSRPAKKLAGWLAVAQLLHLFTLWKFIDWTITDYGASYLAANLPGRLVALSFSFVALRYYSFIFSGVSGAGISSGTDRLFRLSAFLEWAPILWALRWPSSWPFCVAAGTIVIVGTNAAAQRLCGRAGDAVGGVSLLARSAFYAWTGWWEQTAAYGIAMVVLGVFRLFGAVVDEWAYVIITVGINTRNYWYACTLPAPLLRCGLQAGIAVISRERRKVAWSGSRH